MCCVRESIFAVSSWQIFSHHSMTEKKVSGGEQVLIPICRQQNSLWLSHIANAGSSLGVSAGYVGAYQAKVLCIPSVLLSSLITLSKDYGRLQSSKAKYLWEIFKDFSLGGV